MVITPHFLVGAAVASNVLNPILGLPLAFLSHFVLDLIPHRDYVAFPKKGSLLEMREGPLLDFLKRSFGGFLKITADFLLAFSVVFFLADNKVLAIAGGFFAMSPDFDTLAVIFPQLMQNRFFKRFFNFHAKTIHFLEGKKIPIFLKILSQITVAVLALFFLR